VCGAIVTFAFAISRDGTKPEIKVDNEPFSKKKKDQKDEEDRRKRKRIVHAPLFPEPREEGWWVILGDSARGVLVGISKVGSIEDGGADGKIRFVAPNQEGSFGFVGHLMCDGYLGFDQKFEFRIKVVKDEQAEKERLENAERAKLKKEKKKAEGAEEEDEDDLSDEDEDDEEDEPKE